MSIEPNVNLSTLSPNQTFQADGTVYGIVLDAGLLPAPDAGKLWVMDLSTALVVQNDGTRQVIPVPLKVVHA